jgi:hypothetical protein
LIEKIHGRKIVVEAKNRGSRKNHDRKTVAAKSWQQNHGSRITAAESWQQSRTAAKLRQQIWQLQKVGSSVTTSDFHIGIVPIVAWYGIGLDDCYRIKGMVLAHGLV